MYAEEERRVEEEGIDENLGGGTGAAGRANHLPR